MRITDIYQLSKPPRHCKHCGSPLEIISQPVEYDKKSGVASTYKSVLYCPRLADALTGKAKSRNVTDYIHTYIIRTTYFHPVEFEDDSGGG